MYPALFNQTTDPFVGSVVGTLNAPPFQIAAAEGPNGQFLSLVCQRLDCLLTCFVAPSLFSYYQILIDAYCGFFIPDGN